MAGIVFPIENCQFPIENCQLLCRCQHRPVFRPLVKCLGLIGAVPLLGAWEACLAAPAAAPGVPMEAGSSWSPFEVRTVEGDWQQNSVTAIVQTHDGYLWLGTYHGLVRFDGVSFTAFDAGNTPSLRDGRITSLFEGPDRTLWIGHETGELTRMVGGRFHSVPLGSNWVGGTIQAITCDEAEDVWLINDTGVLLRLRDGRTARTPGGGSTLSVTTFARAKDGRLWMASYGQIATLIGGSVVPVLSPENPALGFHERVFPANDGGVWISGHGRLRKWRDGGWAAEVVGFPREPGAIAVMAESPSGLVIGTLREGLYLLRPGATPLHFGRTNGLSHEWIRALSVDREGNCWIGTGAGFDALRLRKVRVVSPPDGWQGFGVLSFSVDSDDTAWVGTEGGGLYRYDGHAWSVFAEAAGLSSPFVWSVLETRERELFVGTWGRGLFRWNGKRFETPGELTKLTLPVTALYQGRGGELWIGTQEGLHRYEAGKLIWFAGKDKLALPDVRTITESADGALWFGMSGGGLGVLRGGELRQFRRGDGLGSDLVSCLHAEADGTLWIGTTDNGLTRFRAGQFAVISAAHGLPSKIICHLVDDGMGYLWIGSQGGVSRVSKADLHACADGQTATVRCLSYGRTEGLTSPACTGGFQPGACRSADGRLWFPTVKGLAVVDPANVTTNPVPPPVAIEALFMDGLTTTNWLQQESFAPGFPPARLANESVPVPQRESGKAGAAAPLVIPPGHRRFEFRYTGLSFVAPDKVRFRRRLEGLERDWVDAGTKRLAEYSYLPPGNYTFRVTACNNDGLWNETGASFSFVVLPFFWQTIWFRVASIVAGAAAVAASVLVTVRRRLRRKLEQLERQRALERERARIARDIHDELGASLTRISMLSQSVRHEVRGLSPAGLTQAAADADQIHGTARELTRAMDEIVWAVNPRHDTLDSLAVYLGRFAQHFLSGAGIRCRLNLPVQLPPMALTAEVRHNVFLAFKEALHNVVKHAHATEVSVSLELRPPGFELRVADNGCGFLRDHVGPPAEAGGDGLRSATGDGLANMRKRMEEIGGRCRWESAPGDGTRVTLTVAIKS